MNSDGHVFGCILDGGVNQRSILSGKDVEVLSSSSSSLAHLQVAKVGQVGIVELNKGAAGFTESLDFGTVGSSQIFEEVIQVGVSLDVDGSSSSSEMRLWTESQA